MIAKVWSVRFEVESLIWKDINPHHVWFMWCFLARVHPLPPSPTTCVAICSRLMWVTSTNWSICSSGVHPLLWHINTQHKSHSRHYLTQSLNCFRNVLPSTDCVTVLTRTFLLLLFQHLWQMTVELDSDVHVLLWINCNHVVQLQLHSVYCRLVNVSKH